MVQDEFVTGPGWGIVHIELAAEADLLAVIPATANIIAKIAAGIADDALTSTVLAATCPLFMAPAMNTHMYENPATQQNLQTLRQRGWQVMSPANGRLACGAVGRGKLPAVEEIESAAVVLPALASGGDSEQALSRMKIEGDGLADTYAWIREICEEKSDAENFHDIVVKYHLKNGRTAYYKYRLPIYAIGQFW